MQHSNVLTMKISFAPLNIEHAEEIISWRYQPPYEVYDYRNESPKAAIEYLTEPANRFYAVLRDDELIGFRSFGEDGRVSGGDYDEPCLDTGGGLCPELTGLGLGEDIIRKGIEFGARKFGAKRFRVTIAEFNERALKVCKRVGFIEDYKFSRVSDGEPFVVLTVNVAEKFSKEVS